MGSHVQDILFVAKPAFQLTTNQSNEKIMNVNGFPNDFLAKGVAGRNPYLKEVKWPKILKGEHPTPEQLQQRVDHKHYHQFKYDIEVVDFYQLICFLLQIDPQEHDGSWD